MHFSLCLKAVSKPTSSPFPSHCELLTKMFRKRNSQTTSPYNSALGRDSNNTLVDPQRSTKKGGKPDPDVIFGTLASTYGWGGHVPAPLPEKSKKNASKRSAPPPPPHTPTPTSTSPSPPRQQTLTQAQREQAVADLASRYGWAASSFPGCRWKM
ncbi:hypothetical protein B0F90DRAFT_824826 [Multifurca ochricompacta]|uniref:Uncharacterized protein n=1 Tax=Multifurca ochricompacta TaxID=376703 RepID=A0AAD4M1S7_9AGAM|nr:hypothetical protein B0F90DRAFT_824826 [Multifurca ochricompacta]